MTHTNRELITWKQMLNAEFPPLCRAGVATVTYQSKYIIIIGGRNNDTHFLDVWGYDTQEHKLNTWTRSKAPGAPRAYHTATIVSTTDEIWIVGGSGKNEILADVLCFNLRTRQWSKPPLNGAKPLLQRTAHAACIHPSSPHTILIFGGYGLGPQETGEWLSDLVTIDTKSGHVEQIQINGSIPKPRGYHSFTAVGKLCIALFGRETDSQLIPSKEFVIYDTEKNKWIAFGDKIKGNRPLLRSSPGTSGTGCGVLVFGWAPPKGPATTEQPSRLNDVQFLKVNQDTYEVEWVAGGPGGSGRRQSNADMPSWPQGRAGHGQAIVKGRFYIFGGYSMHKQYSGNLWEGQLNEALFEAAFPKKVEARGAADQPVPIDANGWNKTRKRGSLMGLTDIIGGAGKEKKAKKTDANTRRQSARIVAKETKKTYEEEEIIEDTIEERSNIDKQPLPAPSTTSPLHSKKETPINKFASPSQRIESLERQLLRYHIMEEQWEKERKRLQGENTTFQRELATADENWKGAKRQLNEAENTILGRLKRQQIDLEAKHCGTILNLEREKDALALQLSAADERAKLLENQITEMQGGHKALEGRLNEVLNESKQNKDLWKGAKEQAALLEQALAHAIDAKTNIEAELNKEKTTIANQRQAWDTERNTLRSELADGKHQVIEAKQREANAERQRQQALDDLERSKEEVSRLQERLNKAHAEIRRAEEGKDEAERELRKLRDEERRLKEVLDSQRQRIEDVATVLKNQSRKLRGGDFRAGPSRIG